MSDPVEIATGLARFGAGAGGRAPGSDAERRAALWLGNVLEQAGREVAFETEWVRPNWRWAYALHCLLGVSGGLLALAQPLAGLALASLAAVSMALDLLGRGHLLRRITPERATQNVVSGPTAATSSGAQRIVRLVIVAHYDAPRSGIAAGRRARRLAAGAQRLAAGRAPGALGLVAIALVVLALGAGARAAGADERWLDVAQLVPTLAALLALGLLVDAGLSRVGPGAGDPGSGAAVAIALAVALDSSPPQHLGVELVLAGAGDGPSLGMRGYVHRRRRRFTPEATAVLHVAACGRGRPCWWTVDGPLVPRRLHPRMVALCGAAVGTEPRRQARAHRGHGSGAAWRARLAAWPAITIGCLDGHGLVPGSGATTDTADRLDAEALGAALGFCLELVRRLDADLARRVTPS